MDGAASGSARRVTERFSLGLSFTPIKRRQQRAALEARGRPEAGRGTGAPGKVAASVTTAEGSQGLRLGEGSQIPALHPRRPTQLYR